MLALVFAYICLLWYAVMLTAAFCGFYSIFTKFTHPPKPLSPPSRPESVSEGNVPEDGENEDARFIDFEPVTIIRPIKGVDPELISCLESSFLQNYPPSKVQILFCVADSYDPAVPVLHSLKKKHPHIDAEVLVSEPGNDYFGPNPKVNNLVKGYLAARHDLLWIMDSNVWASRDVLANSVGAMMNNTNCGVYLGNTARRVKLVHHVPLALALDPAQSGVGGLLDEMFLFTSHSKFYVSLNNLAIAPCVNGKSNLYRKSDLDYAVSQIPLLKSPFFRDHKVVQDALRISEQGPGHAMEFFAKYIGEDNMIGIALWEHCMGRTALTGDCVVQPLKSQNRANSLGEYCNRRVRWLRVRKYMVLAATLVEPTTESLVCGVIGTFALSRLLFNVHFSVRFFAFHMACWLACDYTQSRVWANHLASTSSGPSWIYGNGLTSRPFLSWLKVWCMREALALPIWIAAMVGHEIEWRGKPFKIKKDLSVEEL